MKRLRSPVVVDGIDRDFEYFNVSFANYSPYFVTKRWVCMSWQTMRIPRTEHTAWDRFSVTERSAFLRAFFTTFYIHQCVQEHHPTFFHPRLGHCFFPSCFLKRKIPYVSICTITNARRGIYYPLFFFFLISSFYAVEPGTSVWVPNKSYSDCFSNFKAGWRLVEAHRAESHTWIEAEPMSICAGPSWLLQRGDARIVQEWSIDYRSHDAVNHFEDFSKYIDLVHCVLSVSFDSASPYYLLTVLLENVVNLSYPCMPVYVSLNRDRPSTFYSLTKWLSFYPEHFVPEEKEVVDSSIKQFIGSY
jgi:hypothetical protein